MNQTNESLLLVPTKNSPLIDFNVGGVLVIEGRSIDEEIERIFVPAIEWCKSLVIQFVYLTIKLDYVNNSSARQLNQIFLQLENNTYVNEIDVSWYTDMDDCGQYEMAEMFRDLHKGINFRFFRI